MCFNIYQVFGNGGRVTAIETTTSIFERTSESNSAYKMIDLSMVFVSFRYILFVRCFLFVTLTVVACLVVASSFALPRIDRHRRSVSFHFIWYETPCNISQCKWLRYIVITVIIYNTSNRGRERTSASDRGRKNFEKDIHKCRWHMDGNMRKQQCEG